jgi:hypothetical protein
MKILLSGIFAVICYAGIAQSFTEQDLQRIKSYCKGEFMSDTSALAGNPRKKLSVRPLWEKRKDGIWLLVTMDLPEKDSIAGNAFVWHFYTESNAVLLLQLLSFKEPEKVKELKTGVKKDTDILLQDLKSMNGCELYLTRDKQGNYTGQSKGKDCYLETFHAEYVQYEAAFQKNSLTWKAKAFDKEDKLLMPDIPADAYKKIPPVNKK